MVFDADSVSGEELQLNADYPGVRVRFVGRLGTARVPMQLDVNFTDAVEPPAIEIDYPTLLDMPHPKLLAYSYPTLIAEKLQAIVFLDRLNSRMKDFYDI
jgi:hypothetical protein